MILCATPDALRHPVGWFSPNYKDMVEVWRATSQRLAPVVGRQSTSERRLEFVTGGVLEFWSLDNPQAGRGRKYRQVVIDEAAFVPGLFDSWNYAIRPTLADMQGAAWFLSTPKGRNGFWKLYQYGQDTEEPEWASWQMPSEVNPLIPPDELAAMRRQLPEMVARQELDAEFIDDAGGVFRRVMDAARATGVDAGAIDRQYAFGIDWAYSGDFTAVAVVDMGAGALVYLDRYNGVDYTMQRERIKALATRFRPVVIISEANAMGQPNNEELRASGLDVMDFTTSGPSKEKIIVSLAGAFERGDISIIPDPVLINELQAYEGKRLPGGMTRYSAPPGMHDDTVMALALAWHGAAEGISHAGVTQYAELSFSNNRPKRAGQWKRR